MIAFCVYPITLKRPYIADYLDKLRREDHFAKVYEHLVKPAARAAGYDVANCIAVGSVNILNRIKELIRNSDLLICDISCANPNVFFEFGLRYSLNKRFCLIKDNKTINKQPPFDLFDLNLHSYDARVSKAPIKKETDELAKHIGDCSAGNTYIEPMGECRPDFHETIDDICDLLFMIGAKSATANELRPDRRTAEIRYVGLTDENLLHRNILSYVLEKARKSDIIFTLSPIAD